MFLKKCLQYFYSKITQVAFQNINLKKTDNYLPIYVNRNETYFPHYAWNFITVVICRRYV